MEEEKIESTVNKEKHSSQPINSYKDIPHHFKYGRKRLEIPISKENLNEEVIKKYLPHILRKFSSNCNDYKHLHNVYKGKSHILNKQRPFDSTKSNNIIDERHPYSMVEFKKGYMYGDDVKYSCSNESTCTDDISWISKYMKDQKKARKNVEIAEDVYVAGAGNRFILPKRIGNSYNILRNAPFDIFNLEYTSSFIVYSSNYTKEKLFGAVITTIDSLDPIDTKYEIMIYDYMWSYRFTCSNLTTYGIDDFIFIEKARHYIGYCPFVEYKINKSRMGIVEIVESILDANNVIASNSVDNVVDFVNSIIVVYNATMDGEAKKAMEETGSLLLKTTNPSTPVDVKYLVNSLQHGDVEVIKESLTKIAYNIVGVPQASTQSTSGGDTGQARLLGGGWSRADIVAKQDEICLSEAESEMLEICISICEMHPKCPVNELYASDIEINFNRTKNDNLLVKTQSLQSLIAMNMPKETALNIVGVTANPHEVAHDWDLNDIKKQTDTLAMMQKQAELSKSKEDVKDKEVVDE